MVKVDAIEGTVDDVLWYHYDIASDVLYLRIAKYRSTSTVAEETPDGFILLRREDTSEVVGMTAASWWKRFGTGAVPDSISTIEKVMGPFIHTHKFAA